MPWKRVVMLIVLALSPGSVARSEATPDDEIVAVLKRSNSQISKVRVWRRLDVGQDLDLVLAMGTTARWPFDRPAHSSESWGPDRPFSLLLQERSNPGRVYALGTTIGPTGCDTAHIARLGATDMVLTCIGEKSEVGPAYKFVFDPRAKRLVSQFTYQPFVSYDVRRRVEHGVVIRARSLARTVDVAFTVAPSPSFTIRTDARRADGYFDRRAPPVGPRVGTPFGPAGSFRLVELAEMANKSCVDNDVVVHERVSERNRRQYRQPLKECGQIGPSHLDGDRLWFGRTYYAGEGYGGTGGFGYFDTRTRRFQLWSPPELRDWSVSAIHLTADSAWLGLVNHGEYGDSTGGILRFSRDGQLQRRYQTPRSIASSFVTIDGVEYALSDTGILRLDDSGVRGFMVDQTSDGRLRVVESLP